MPFISNEKIIAKDVQIGLLTAQVASLIKEVETAVAKTEAMEKRLLTLQDVIISIRAPEAYNDMKADQGVDNSVNTREILKNLSNLSKYEQEWFQKMEEPTFKSADDMIEILSSGFGAPRGTTVHENDES